MTDHSECGGHPELFRSIHVFGKYRMTAIRKQSTLTQLELIGHTLVHLSD
jgi:hypothetical protein